MENIACPHCGKTSIVKLNETDTFTSTIHTYVCQDCGEVFAKEEKTFVFKAKVTGEKKEND